MAASVVLNVGTDAVSLVLAAPGHLVAAVGTAGTYLARAGPTAYWLLHGEVEWLFVIVVFLATIVSVPFVRVLHSLVDDASGFFDSWKSNRIAAVHAAEAFRAPVKVRQFIVKPLLVRPDVAAA
jgi:hypothetical protein